MANYKLIPEEAFERLLGALEGVKAELSAITMAGTVTIPVDGVGRTTDSPASRGRRDVERLAKAREVIERVGRGGAKHSPKAFDREGPRISDFCYLLMNGRFTPPEAVGPIGKFVSLKESKREASGQIRTAVKNDPRFSKQSDGSYLKVR